MSFLFKQTKCPVISPRVCNGATGNYKILASNSFLKINTMEVNLMEALKESQTQGNSLHCLEPGALYLTGTALSINVYLSIRRILNQNIIKSHDQQQHND
jgi:hypothetical protein